MKTPSEYPAGWRRSVANEHRIDEIVRGLRDRQREIDELPPLDAKEIAGEVVGGVCFCLCIVLLFFIGAALT